MAMLSDEDDAWVREHMCDNCPSNDIPGGCSGGNCSSMYEMMAEEILGEAYYED